MTNNSCINDNRFIKKFESRSDAELESIALGSKTYTLEARIAAMELLKGRNVSSECIDILEEEVKKKALRNRKNATIDFNSRELIRKLRILPMRKTANYGLKNGNILKVKKLRDDLFQVRIEDHYRSFLGPVLICRILNDTEFRTYPFLYLKSLLVFGFGGSLVILFLSSPRLIELDLFLIFYPVVFALAMQLLVMPFAYFVTLKFFKETLGTKMF